MGEMKTKMHEVVETTGKQVSLLKSCIKEKELALEELALSSKSEIDFAKNANNALQKDVATCKADIDEISRQLLDKHGIISSLEDKIKSLENEKTEQLAIVASQDSKIDELQSMMKETKLAYQSAQELITKLEQESQNNSDKFNSYKSDAECQIEELQTELTELTDSLTQLSTQYNEMTSKHDRVDSENKSLKESISQLVKCVEELQEKQESCETEIKNLTDACSLTKKNELELKCLVEDKDARLQELLLSKDEIEAQLKSTDVYLESVKSKEVEYLQEIERLKLSNSAKDSKLIELEQMSSEFDLQSKTVASDLDRKLVEYDKLKLKCEQIEQDYQSMALTFSEKECELKQLVSKNEALKQQVNKFVHKMQHLEDNHSYLNGSVSVLQENLDSCNSELVSLKDIVQHQENILAKKDELAEKLKYQIKSSTKKISDLSKTAMQLEKNLSDVSSEKDRVEKMVEEKMDICRGLEKKNLQLQLRVDELLLEVEKSKSLIDSTETDSSDLQKKLSDHLKRATTSLLEKDVQIKNLTDDLAQVKEDLSKELNKLQLQKEACEKENVELNSSIANKTADIAALAVELDKLQNKNNKLEAAQITSISTTTEELESLNLKIISLEQDKNEIGVLKEKQNNFKITNQKLKEKEAQLKTAKANLKELKNDYSNTENGYLSTIDKLK